MTEEQRELLERAIDALESASVWISRDLHAFKRGEYKSVANALRAALAADERERSAPASREQMEAFAARLKAIIDDGLRRQSEAAPDAPQAKQSEPVSNTIRTAPKRIWLNVFTDEDDADFPSNHEGITWCEDEVGDADVQYIRADLAAPQAEQRALENCRMFAARHRKEYWAQTILRFCADGGATGSPLRGAQPDASISVPQAEQPEPSAFDTLPDDYETGDY